MKKRKFIGHIRGNQDLNLCKTSSRFPDVFGESLSVLEGDAVLLHTDVTAIHEDDDILWKFGAEKSLIAQINKEKQIFPDERFRDRLKLDRQTGSLTITNITTQHTGRYELEINGKKRSTKTFSVSVYVHLPNPNITRNFSQNSSSSSSSSSSSYCSLLCSVVNVGNVSLSWYKGNSLLSSISVSDLSISLSLPLEVEYQEKNTYSCVLNNPISNQTTHLDISQLCQPHSGQTDPFILFIIDQAAVGMCCICRKCRKITSICSPGVFGSETNELQSLSVVAGDSVTLNTTITEIPEEDDILWKFGVEKPLIAQINRAYGIINTYNEGRFRDRLRLDNQTGSLTITNITTHHAGLYKLQINGAERSSKTFSVSVYGDINSSHCTSSSSSSSCSLVCSVVNVSRV
uniref:Ig-like domain-containing protein n=1 Tax=Sinocyclocheilus grahami TaxID=75366 RepID=A0A672KFR4_SINGR